MTCFRRNRRRGFTLTELALVMGVIGGIIAAVWVASAKTQEARRDNDAVTELQTVVNNISTMLAGRSLSLCGGANPITPCMITAQAVPSSYVNLTNSAFADNPWSPQGFYVWYVGWKTFRIAFYNVSRPGCQSLLMQATACQVGQSGCPIVAYTNYGASNLSPSATTGWPTVMTATAANALCAANNYSGGNSVEFDYSL